MQVYKIVRYFFYNYEPKTIKKNLSLEEAQQHILDPETSSSTCKKRINLNRTKIYGPWFDVYTEQK